MKHRFSAFVALQLMLFCSFVHAAAIAPYLVHAKEFDKQSSENFAQLYADAGTERRYKLYVRIQYDVNIRNRTLAISNAVADLQSHLGFDSPTSASFFWHLPDEPVVYIAATQARLTSLLAYSGTVAFRKERLFEPQLIDSLGQIGHGAATAIGFNGTGKNVVIIDSGVDKTHPLLSQGRVVNEGCFSTPGDYFCPGVTPSSGTLRSVCGNNANPGQTGVGTGKQCSLVPTPSQYEPLQKMEGCGHGTHVAAIAASASPQSGIVSLQVSSLTSAFCHPSTGRIIAERTIRESDVLQALRYVLDNPANVGAVNLSLGNTCDPAPWAEFETIVSALSDLGIATIVATGNTFNQNSFSSPGCNSATAIKVGAVRKDGTFATYTDTIAGPNNYLLAPGGNSSTAETTLPCNPSTQCVGSPNIQQCNICSANPLTSPITCSTQDILNFPCSCGNPSPPSFCGRGGTSMAAPHVAASFAMLRAKFPASPNDSFVSDAYELLESTGTDVLVHSSYTKRSINIGNAAKNSGNPTGLVISTPVCGTARVGWTEGSLGNPDTFNVQMSTTSNFASIVEQTVPGTARQHDFAWSQAGTIYARVRGCFNGTCPDWGTGTVPGPVSMVTQACSAIGPVQNLVHINPTQTGGCSRLTWTSPALGVVGEYRISKDGVTPPATTQQTRWTTHSSGVTIPPQPHLYNGLYSVAGCNGPDCGPSTSIQVDATGCYYIQWIGLEIPSLLEDMAGGPFAVSVGRPNPENVSITAISESGPIPASGFVFSGTGASRTLSITPSPDLHGSASVTFEATDVTTSQTVPTSRVLEVLSVNDAPGFDFRNDCSVASGTWTAGANPPEFLFSAGNQGVQSCDSFIVPTFGPSNESDQGLLAIEISENSNPAMFSQQPSINVKNLLSFQLNGQAGTSDLQIHIRDNGGTENGGIDLSAPRTFRVRVQGAAPTMSTISDQTILEDAVTDGLSLNLADADTDPLDLVVTASSSNSALVPNGNVVIGGSGTNRIVTVTPLANQFGFADITLTVSDGAQQTQQVFRVNVTSVNDAPTFVAGPDVILPTGTTDDIYQDDAWATQVSVGPQNEIDPPQNQIPQQFLITQLSGSVVSIGASLTVDVPSGNLTVQLQPIAGTVPDGFACFRVRLRDSGPSSAPNVNISAGQIVKVEVGNGGHNCNN